MPENTNPEDDLFEAALLKSPGPERAAFLDGECRGDPELRARVELMLEGHLNAKSFLEPLPDGVSPERTIVSQETAGLEQLGSNIGPYKLRQKLGEGGCGVVYLAEQNQPVRRRVALKIIKLGMDTRSVIARFEAERQALALMDHPNIAKVFDAGTTETGRPYFVMELVRGIRISEYCDQNQLSTGQRLGLFIQVCQAIQHAHQKGIIHRDIKPSNILITLHDGVPVPKVIDFGIAKATCEQRLTDKTIFTAFEQFIGTPAYMSPEQAEMSGLDIDTRSDIYSLGVLLYELLTGSTPFDAKELLASGLDAMRKTIREKEAVRPSTKFATLQGDELATTAKRRSAEPSRLVHQLKGDLDWIIMKCLEKDRTRRYETANGLAADLKRHLSNEPVVARPPSTAYRFQKAFRRNKLVFTAATAVAAALVIGLGAATVMFFRERLARKDEQQQRLAAESAQKVAQTEQQRAAKRSSELATARTHAEAETSRAQQNLYVSDMNLAAQAWEAGNLVRARELLDKYRSQPGRADLRGFEWRMLWGLAHEDSAKVIFDSGATGVTALALSPEGKQLALGRDDRTVQIMDLENQRVWRLAETNPIAVTSLAFSSDGTRLATGRADGAIKLWEGANWRALAGHTGAVTYLAFHPNGETLLSSGGDGTIKRWDLATGRKLQVSERPDAGAPHLSISPEGTTLATFGGLNNTARFWTLAANSERLAELPPQKGIILDVEFSPDAKSVIISTHDSLVTRWELPSLKPLVTYWQKVLVEQLALSADGQILATAGSDNLVKIWDVKSGQELRVLRGHTAGISHLVFSADGRTLASVGGGHTVRVWSIGGREEKDVLPHHGIVVHMAVSPDGKMLATSDPNFRTVKLWDLGAQRATTFLTNDKAQVAFSPDGKWFALVKFTGALELWDLSAKPYLKGPTNSAGFAAGTHLNFSRNGRILACRGTNETVMLWNLSDQSTVRFLPNHSGFSCVTAFSPDSEIIATAANQQIRLWHVISQQLLATVPNQHSDIRSIAFSPDGRTLAAASGNTEVRLWDVSDPMRPQPLPALRGHTSFVPALAFSPDGKTLATGSVDSSLKLWDLALGQSVATLRGHSSVVACLAFAPGGNTIYTGSGDATVRVWHAPSLDEIAAEEKKSAEAK